MLKYSHIEFGVGYAFLKIISSEYTGKIVTYQRLEMQETPDRVSYWCKLISYMPYLDHTILKPTSVPHWNTSSEKLILHIELSTLYKVVWV